MYVEGAPRMLATGKRLGVLMCVPCTSKVAPSLMRGIAVVCAGTATDGPNFVARVVSTSGSRDDECEGEGGLLSRRGFGPCRVGAP